MSWFKCVTYIAPYLEFLQYFLLMELDEYVLIKFLCSGIGCLNLGYISIITRYLSLFLLTGVRCFYLMTLGPIG